MHLKNIIKNGGGTLNSRGETVQYQDGYQVSHEDLYVLDIDKIEEISTAILFEMNKIQKNEFLGLLIDEGKIYIDKSKHFEDRTEAVIYGNIKNQKSIFDWKTKECIYLI